MQRDKEIAAAAGESAHSTLGCASQAEVELDLD